MAGIQQRGNPHHGETGIVVGIAVPRSCGARRSAEKPRGAIKVRVAKSMNLYRTAYTLLDATTDLSGVDSHDAEEQDNPDKGH